MIEVAEVIGEVKTRGVFALVKGFSKNMNNLAAYGGHSDYEGENGSRAVSGGSEYDVFSGWFPKIDRIGDFFFKVLGARIQPGARIGLFIASIAGLRGPGAR